MRILTPREQPSPTPKILILVSSVDSPSVRYRVAQFLPLLQYSGLKVSVLALSGNQRAAIKALYLAGQSDLTIILRKTFSDFFFGILRLFSKKIIFEFDDAIFSNSNGSRSYSRERRFLKCIKKVDGVICGNDYLRLQTYSFYGSAALPIAVIPTVVDISRFDLPAIHLKSKIVKLVWIGSASTSKYLRAILPILESVYSTCPSFCLKVISNDVIESDVLPVINIKWSESTEVAELKESDIGIAPMAEDSWTRGKCALKIIQYMAAGLPVIASPVGANAEVVLNGQTGLLADDPPEWREALIALISNSSMRAQMGYEGRCRARDCYSIDSVGKSYVDFIGQLLTAPAKRGHSVQPNVKDRG